MRSAGSRDHAMATILPSPVGDACDYPICQESDVLVTVDPDDRERERRTVCAVHLIEYLKELSS